LKFCGNTLKATLCGLSFICVGCFASSNSALFGATLHGFDWEAGALLAQSASAFLF
jgi:hypothetical protein